MRANIIAFVIGLAAALLAAEGVTRLVWDDAPAAAAAGPSLPIVPVRDPRVLYRLPPGATGLYNGTPVTVNALGLRDRDYAIPAPAGMRRVMLLGDSMVFGVGLPADKTLSSQIEQRVNKDGGGPVEVINAGIFGYNIVQEISLLEEVGPRYRPDLVIACFVHNDMENWGLGDGGAVPVIASSRFEPPPKDAWSTRLAELMVPGAFDPERLNLLPGEEAKGVRGWLAAHSRLYLFAHLRLRTHSWNLTSGERRDPIVDSRSCRTREVIWESLRSRYREMSRLASGWGGKVAVVVLGGQLWEGRPLEELLAILREEKIPHLDLTPVWKDPGFYAKEYSLGWDPHPNERATALAAGLIVDSLGGFMKGAADAGPHAAIAARADLVERLTEWEAAERERVARDDEAWSTMQRGLAPALDASQGTLAGNPQILYGFWNDMSGETGLWMSRTGALLLGNPGDAARARGVVALDLTLPAVPAASADPTAAESLLVTLSAPPDRCGVASGAHALRPDSAGQARLRIALPDSLRGAATIEVRLEAGRSFAASALFPAGDAGGQRGARRVALSLARAALEKADSDAVPASDENARRTLADRDLH